MLLQMQKIGYNFLPADCIYIYNLAKRLALSTASFKHQYKTLDNRHG